MEIGSCLGASGAGHDPWVEKKAERIAVAAHTVLINIAGRADATFRVGVFGAAAGRRLNQNRILFTPILHIVN